MSNYSTLHGNKTHLSSRSRAHRDPGRGQCGQALVLVLVVIVFAGLVSAGVVHLGMAVAQRSSVQAAADAVALAGASKGADAASRVASANNVVVESFRQHGADVIVSVRRSKWTAQARARWSVDPDHLGSD
ncbi:MAG: hypothetical protein KDA95_03825 [Acidimicrobiales bacterium]|nr:hypothetical protein [Acidimicrobiales bacterium]